MKSYILYDERAGAPDFDTENATCLEAFDAGSDQIALTQCQTGWPWCGWTLYSYEEDANGDLTQETFLHQNIPGDIRHNFPGKG